MRLEIGFGTVVAVLVAVGAAFVVAAFVNAASQPLGWVLACGVVATLVYPIVGWLDRRLPRAVAVIIVVLGVGLLLGGAWLGVAGTVSDNVETLRERAPEAAAELEESSEVAADFRLGERVSAFVEDLDERLGARAQLARSPSTLSTYVVTGILVVFFIVYGPRMATSALQQFDDADRRSRIESVVGEAVASWRVYALVTVAQIVVITLLVWPVLYVLDLPAPFVLALFMGALSVIPFAGIVFGAIPALLFAAGFGDAVDIVVVLGLAIALQVIEVMVVRRRVDPRSIYLGPALPLIVALIGWELYGLGGVIYGVLLLILALAVVDAVGTDDDHTGAAMEEPEAAA